ncbi:hypothetical protein GUA87_17285 [Sneathiella sp. P13V-1]|uniref:hemerythrin domain-containing protein n=1 Tax=Sneathiella sp. P13V-1 TaxID=2697366 RepID=UPI00187B3E05|nr:hemerythrin domain-containing protein [Sneathiella sp. P13V-1]MBE7638613.1 hypothetical protein [Sneathiella sp. P13V-1]
MKVLDKLISDHAQMSKMLVIMDEEIRVFVEGGTLDYLLLQTALDFMDLRTTTNHHIFEEKMASILMLKGVCDKKLFDHLEVDHERISFLGNELKNAIDNVEQDNQLPRIWVLSVMQEYINVQRRHMLEEEKTIFPMAKLNLTTHDWASLDDLAKEMLVSTSEEEAELASIQKDVIAWHMESHS